MVRTAFGDLAGWDLVLCVAMLIFFFFLSKKSRLFFFFFFFFFFPTPSAVKFRSMESSGAAPRPASPRLRSRRRKRDIVSGSELSPVASFSEFSAHAVRRNHEVQMRDYDARVRLRADLMLFTAAVSLVIAIMWVGDSRPTCYCCCYYYFIFILWDVRAMQLVVVRGDCYL
jgi:hypothetical protein